MSKPNYKIENIVSQCNNCKHCMYASNKDAQYHFAICTFHEDFILHSGSEHPKHYKLEIPNDCPLDNFEGNHNKYIQVDAD